VALATIGRVGPHALDLGGGGVELAEAAAGDRRWAVEEHEKATAGRVELRPVDVVYGIAVAVSGFVFTVQVKQKRGYFGVTEAHGYTFHA
jgi:hypothetical protein